MKMTREAAHGLIQGMLDRLEARKDLAIAKVAPKLVGVEDVAEVEEILNELRDEMLDELDAIERSSGSLAAFRPKVQGLARVALASVNTGRN